MVSENFYNLKKKGNFQALLWLSYDKPDGQQI